MEKYRSPVANRHYVKEIKSITLKSKDNESFHHSKSPNIIKNYSEKEIIPYKNMKKNTHQKDIMPRYNNTELKKNDKKQIIKNENPIKETILHNFPFGSQGRNQQKELPERNNKNNSYNRNTDFNEKNNFKNLTDFGQKNKNNLPGNYGNTENANNNYIQHYNSFNNNNNTNNRMNINPTNLKNNNVINSYNNKDNIQNKNINKEKTNLNNQNNYINYNIINNNINTSDKITKADNETDNFKNFNSLCVSINNNYNYNVSLETPPTHPENYNDLINKAFIPPSKDEKNLQNSNKNKDVNLEKNWKEKIAKINKQKNMDYTKKGNNSDTNYRRTKTEVKKNTYDFSDDIYNRNMNNSQKIKKTYSSTMNRENNFNKSEKTKRKGDSSNEPKKKSGLLGFLHSFKDFFAPVNKKSKNNNNNNSNNNSFNLGNNNRKENMLQNNNNNNNNNNNTYKSEKINILFIILCPSQNR